MRFLRLNSIFVFAVFLLTASFLYGSSVYAQDVSEDVVQTALQDLSDTVGFTITTKEEAREICNQEAFLNACVDVGKRNGLYSEEKREEVDRILEEFKAETIEELEKCKTEECILDVANVLANRISKDNVALASRLDLTPDKVTEKKKIADTAKELGVNVEACRRADPDTASVELLRGCFRLANDSRIKEYIPERGINEKKDRGSDALELSIALREGRYQCGDNTPEGCGSFCLNPQEGVSGVEGIPLVCREIAEEFFGDEGIGELEKAYARVKQVDEYVKFKEKNFVFTTGGGRKIYNPEDIGIYLEGEAENGNLSEVERGMDFLIAQGFIKQEDKIFALEVMRGIGGGENSPGFGECRRNPRACDSFVSEDVRDGFGAIERVHTILENAMRDEGVPNPELCEDEQYGDSCLRAAKRVLPEIDAIAKDFPVARVVVNEVRSHIEFGEKGNEALGRAREEFNKEGGRITVGDRDFTNFEDMKSFCASNGSLCLTDAARRGFVERDFAEKKYERTFNTKYDVIEFFPDDGHFEDFNNTPDESFFPRSSVAFPVPDGLPGSRLSVSEKENLMRQFGEWLDSPDNSLSEPDFSYREPYRDTNYPNYRDDQYRDDQYRDDQYRDVDRRYYNDPYVEKVFITPVIEKCMRRAGVREQVISDMLAGREGSPFGKRTAFECRDVKGSIPVTPDQPICADISLLYPLPCGRIGEHREIIVNESGCKSFGKCVPDDEPFFCPQIYPGFCAPGELPKPPNPDDRCGRPSCILVDEPIVCPLSPVRYCDEGEEPIPPRPDDPCGNYSCVVSYEPSTPFPYEFSDGIVVNNYEDAKNHCYKYRQGSGRGIAGECETVFGIYSFDPDYPDTDRDDSGWVNHTWVFSDGSTTVSSILPRTDSEYLDYIKKIDAECIGIIRNKFFWRQYAGDDSSDNWRNFGIPDCSGTGTGEVEPPYPPYTDDGRCPSGFHWHDESGGYCINDQENVDGLCYGSDGVTKITCPLGYTTYEECNGHTSESFCVSNGCGWYTEYEGEPFCGGSKSTQSSSTCGDNICESDETISSCASDCDESIPPSENRGCGELRSWCDSYWSPNVDKWAPDSSFRCAQNHHNGYCVGDPSFPDDPNVDKCRSEYGPGWISKGGDTVNCYDQYTPAFKDQEGKLYSCDNIPSGVSAPGCPTSSTTTDSTNTTNTTTVNDTNTTGTSGTTSSCSDYNTESGCQSVSSDCYWEWNSESATTGSCKTGSYQYGECGAFYDESSCVSSTNCYWYVGTGSSSSYCYYQDGDSEYDTGGCPPGFHWHNDSGGYYCINDQEDFNGTCYDSSGTNTIPCPSSESYDNSGACNYNGVCDSGESSGSCPNDCGGGGGDTSSSCNYNGTCDGNENYSTCPGDCGGYDEGSYGDPATVCAESGGVWDSGTQNCDSPQSGSIFRTFVRFLRTLF